MQKSSWTSSGLGCGGGRATRCAPRDHRQGQLTTMLGPVGWGLGKAVGRRRRPPGACR
jgi:hypothetical protein